MLLRRQNKRWSRSSIYGIIMENEELEEDYNRAVALRSERSKTDDNPEDGKEQFTAPPQSHTAIFLLAFLVAIISDIADILIVGAIPLVGDTLDLATGGILTFLFWNIGGRKKITRILPIASMLFEFLPFGFNDLLPTYTVEVIFTWYMIRKEERAGE